MLMNVLILALADQSEGYVADLVGLRSHGSAGLD